MGFEFSEVGVLLEAEVVAGFAVDIDEYTGQAAAFEIVAVFGQKRPATTADEGIITLATQSLQGLD